MNHKTEEPIDRVLKLLNDAHKRDPASVWALLQISIPCNKELTEHPTIITSTQYKWPALGALGLMNSVVFQLTGQMVAAKWSVGDEPQLLGFERYLGALPQKIVSGLHVAVP